MKKGIFAVLIIFCLFITFTFVEKTEANTFSAGGIDIYAEYNFVIFEENMYVYGSAFEKDFLGYQINLFAASGYSLGLEKNITSGISASLEYNRIPVNTEFASMGLNAVRGNLYYRIFSLKIKTGLAYYYGKTKFNHDDGTSETLYFDGSPGFKIGTVYEHDFLENMKICFNWGYRFLKMGYSVFDFDYNLNGIELGLGLNYSF